MAGRKVVIEFLGKDSTSRSVQSVESRYSKLGSKMQKVGRIAGVGLAAGLAVAARGAISAGKAAAEDEAAQSKLAQTLKTATGATKAQVAQNERYITSMGKTLGIADDDLRPALGRLAVATGDVGKAQKLAGLAMDISAGSGKSLDAVTMALVKAQNGSLGGLSRLGVKIKDTDGKTKSLDQVTKELAKTYDGAAAKAADTTAGKQRKLSVQYGELREQIGARLLPVMEKLTSVGLKVVDWLSKNPQVVTAFAVAVGVLAVAFAAAFVAANAIPIAIAALVGALVYAYKKFDWFKAAVDTVFHGLTIAVKWFGEAFRKLYNSVILPVAKLIVRSFGTMLIVWGTLLRALGKVPGFGWAKKAGDAMKTAGGKALGLANNMRQIPDRKNVKFWTNAESVRRSVEKLNAAVQNGKGGKIHYTSGYGGGQTASAGGTNFHPGGMGWVGEEGPELLKIRRGSQVVPNDMLPTGGGGGGDTFIFNITGVLDTTQAGVKLEQVLTKHVKAVGRPLQFVTP